MHQPDATYIYLNDTDYKARFDRIEGSCYYYTILSDLSSEATLAFIESAEEGHPMRDFADGRILKSDFQPSHIFHCKGKTS